MLPMMALWCPSMVSRQILWISSGCFPPNCSAASSSISCFSPLILTWAVPTTLMGTPFSVYTRGLVTCRVITDSGILNTFWTQGRTIALPPVMKVGFPPWHIPEITITSLGPHVTIPISKHILSELSSQASLL